MIGWRKETILGIKGAPHFDPLLMFGFGGIYVGVFLDVIFFLASIRELDARNMVRGIRGKAAQGLLMQASLGYGRRPKHPPAPVAADHGFC